MHKEQFPKSGDIVHILHVFFYSVVSPGYVKTDLSRNALTASGQTYDRLDQATDKGLVNHCLHNLYTSIIKKFCSFV